MMKLAIWQKQKLETALNKLQQIIETAKGNKKSTCACSQEACKDVEMYISTWIMPEIRDVIGDKR